MLSSDTAAQRLSSVHSDHECSRSATLPPAKDSSIRRLAAIPVDLGSSCLFRGVPSDECWISSELPWHGIDSVLHLGIRPLTSILEDLGSSGKLVFLFPGLADSTVQRPSSSWGTLFLLPMPGETCPGPSLKVEILDGLLLPGSLSSPGLSLNRSISPVPSFLPADVTREF